MTTADKIADDFTDGRRERFFLIWPSVSAVVRNFMAGLSQCGLPLMDPLPARSICISYQLC
jgi:hypothetical protein